MSALASDIEDERRPLTSQTSLSYRPISNPYTTNNSSWMIQQQQQQQQQQRYPHTFSKDLFYNNF